MKKDVRKNRMIGAVAAAFFLMVLLDVVFIRMEYENYLEKNHITVQVLSSGHTEEALVKILKGENMDVSRGNQFLKTYGYDTRTGNRFYRTFIRNTIKIVCVSFVFFVVDMLLLGYFYKKGNKEDLKEFQILEQMIRELLQGNVQFSVKEEVHFSYEELERMYMEIDRLRNTYSLLQGRLRQEKEETKGMVTDISHQLKTPVAALETSFEILKEEGITEAERMEFMERCSRQLRGIQNLLDALVNISRMESGMITICPKPACLFDTLVEAVNRVYERGCQKGIQIELEAGEELEELEIPHDVKWLGEALINLLENAIKYSPSHTTIYLRMMKRATFLRLEIEDQGIGVPKEEYNKIFQRFYRGSQEAVRKESGSGVGLYLTREILKMHHGTIRVASGKEGGGALFIIQLPYA